MLLFGRHGPYSAHTMFNRVHVTHQVLRILNRVYTCRRELSGQEVRLHDHTWAIMLIFVHESVTPPPRSSGDRAG